MKMQFGLSRKTLIAGSSGLLACLAVLAVPADKASACEPIADLLLFSSDIPCPCPSPGPQTQSELCVASECRSFGGSDKGQFGQFKKDQAGVVEAIVFKITNTITGVERFRVVQIGAPTCLPQIPLQTGGLTCSGLFKVKGLRPIGEGLNSPLCTFDDLADVNAVTTQNGVIVTDVNGKQCLSSIRSQYWIFFRQCCSPAGLFGILGEFLDIDISLVINNGGVCSVNPVRPDGDDVEAFPATPSSTCL
jgi:hypothetical protein